MIASRQNTIAPMAAQQALNPVMPPGGLGGPMQARQVTAPTAPPLAPQPQPGFIATPDMIPGSMSPNMPQDLREYLYNGIPTSAPGIDNPFDPNYNAALPTGPAPWWTQNAPSTKRSAPEPEVDARPKNAGAAPDPRKDPKGYQEYSGEQSKLK